MKNNNKKKTPAKPSPTADLKHCVGLQHLSVCSKLDHLEERITHVAQLVKDLALVTESRMMGLTALQLQNRMNDPSSLAQAQAMASKVDELMKKANE